MSGPGGTPFPWENGGAATAQAPWLAPGERPKRPLVLILAGIGLFLVSAAVVVADVWGDPGASIVGSIAVYAVGAALAWLAGRRRASGQVVTGGYVAYVVLYLMALGVMVYLSSGAARWWGLIPLVWLACFIAVVELSCIWRRRLYWSGWN